MSKKWKIFGLALLALALCAGAASAAPYIWKGDGTRNSAGYLEWSDPDNWDVGVDYPGKDAAVDDDVIFDGTYVTGSTISVLLDRINAAIYPFVIDGGKTVNLELGRDLKLGDTADTVPELLTLTDGNLYIGGSKAVQILNQTAFDFNVGANALELDAPLWINNNTVDATITLLADGILKLGKVSHSSGSGTNGWPANVTFNLGDPSTVTFTDPSAVKANGDFVITADASTLAFEGGGTYDLPVGFFVGNSTAATTTLSIASGTTVTGSASSTGALKNIPVFKNGILTIVGAGTFEAGGDAAVFDVASVTVGSGGDAPTLSVLQGPALGTTPVSVDRGATLEVANGETLNTSALGFTSGDSVLAVSLVSANRGDAPTMPAIAVKGSVTANQGLTIQLPEDTTASIGELALILESQGTMTVTSASVTVLPASLNAGVVVDGKKLYVSFYTGETGAHGTELTLDGGTKDGYNNTIAPGGGTLTFTMGSWFNSAGERVAVQNVKVLVDGEESLSASKITDESFSLAAPASDAEFEVQVTAEDVNTGRTLTSNKLYVVVGKGTLTGAFAVNLPSAVVGDEIIFAHTVFQNKRQIVAVATSWMLNGRPVMPNGSASYSFVAESRGTYQADLTVTMVSDPTVMSTFTATSVVSGSGTPGRLDDGNSGGSGGCATAGFGVLSLTLCAAFVLKKRA